MGKILFLLLIFILPLQAQDREPNKRFDQAVFLYNNKQYEPALKLFESLSVDESFAYSTPSEIFIGKIYLEQGRTEEAEAKFMELLSSVTENNYRLEILLNSAIVLYNKRMYYESVEMLLDLIEAAPESPYAVYAINVMDTLAVFNLSPDDVKVLYNLSKRELKPLLLLVLGKTYLAEGNSKEAKSNFRQLIKEFPQSSYKKEAEDYLNDRKTIKIPKEGSPVIVVLFPDESGAAGRAVNQISEGIKYSVHEFNADREEKVGLVFLDMQKERVKEIRNEIQGMNVKCVIGPIYSEDVRLVLSEFRGIKLPIISPTATDNGLTSLNEYFFQANPNFTFRGRAMAQYVYYVENKRKMAVLNAIEGYSPLLAAEFIKEFRGLGGEVVIQRTYQSRSGLMDEPASAIFKMIENVEGIYVPVSEKDDIPALLNSLTKNNIAVPLYGNQDWFLGKGYETYPLLINNLIFTSDYFIDFSSFSYNSFNEEFISRTGIEADRNVLYGYDLTKYFLTQMTKINAGPDMIALRMENGNTVTGYHNNISFDEERVNRYVNIVRYREGLFELVDKFRTGNN